MTSRWEQHAACVLALSANHHRPVKEIAKSGWRFTVKIFIRFNINRLQEKPGVYIASVLVRFSLSVSGLTLVGVHLPHNSCGKKLGSSHLPRLVSGPSANTCRYYSEDLWREQPLLNPATCLMMTAAHSPVYSRVALPLPAVCTCSCEGNVLLH